MARKTVTEIKNQNKIRHKIDKLSVKLKEISEQSDSVKINIETTKTAKLVMIRFETTQVS